MGILEDLNSAKENLKDRIELQAIMKKANALVRKKHNTPELKLEEIQTETGLTIEQAKNLLTPDYGGRKGFATYKLTNNNAEIRRLKDRVEKLESKRQGELQVSETGESETWTFDGGKMEANYEADRYQIFFDNIPDADFRAKLKKGWRWSPRYSAWQRKITSNALYSAKSLLPNFSKVVTNIVRTSVLEKEVAELPVEIAPVVEKEEKVRVADLDYLLGLSESSLKNILWSEIPTDVMLQFRENLNKGINANYQTLFKLPLSFVNELKKRTGPKQNWKIEYLNKDKNFQKDLKYFPTLTSAKNWGKGNIPNWNEDMLTSVEPWDEQPAPEVQSEPSPQMREQDDIFGSFDYARYAELTEDNNHPAAAEYLAMYFGSNSDLREVKRLNDIKTPKDKFQIIDQRTKILNGPYAKMLKSVDPKYIIEIDEKYNVKEDVKGERETGDIPALTNVVVDDQTQPETLRRAIKYSSKAEAEADLKKYREVLPSYFPLKESGSVDSIRRDIKGNPLENGWYLVSQETNVPLTNGWLKKKQQELKADTSKPAVREDMEDIRKKVFNAVKDKIYDNYADNWPAQRRVKKEMFEELKNIYPQTPEIQLMDITEELFRDFVVSKGDSKNYKPDAAADKFWLTSMEFEERHPIIILDRESPQWEQSVQEYFNVKPIDFYIKPKKETNSPAKVAPAPKLFDKVTDLETLPEGIYALLSELIYHPITEKLGLSRANFDGRNMEKQLEEKTEQELLDIALAWKESGIVSDTFSPEQTSATKKSVLSFIDEMEKRLGKNKDEAAIKPKFKVGDIVYHNMKGRVKVVHVDLDQEFDGVKEPFYTLDTSTYATSPTNVITFTNREKSLHEADPNPNSLSNKKSIVSFDIKKYENQYVLNKAIENFIDERNIELKNNILTGNNDFTIEQKTFLRAYSGYGGLDKYGPTGKGGFTEYYTPTPVIEKMWALAYKYGYNNGSLCETSVGTGEFLQFAKPEIRKLCFEINKYSAIICKILYPTAEVKHQPFEKHFIDRNDTIYNNTDKLEKFDLVIGNCPYGKIESTGSKYFAMGEKSHVKPKNFTEYFLRRSLDLLNPKGLIVMIVGTSIQGGGTMFLDSGPSPVKDYLFNHSDLLTAYRLPDSVFETTSVTSDILVIQKK